MRGIFERPHGILSFSAPAGTGKVAHGPDLEALAGFAPDLIDYNRA